MQEGEDLGSPFKCQEQSCSCSLASVRELGAGAICKPLQGGLVRDAACAKALLQERRVDGVGMGSAFSCEREENILCKGSFSSCLGFIVPDEF